MHVTVPYRLLSLDSKVAGLPVGRNMSNPYVKPIGPYSVDDDDAEWLDGFC